MLVDYEEKQYEQFFNIEIASIGDFFPIGQIFEGIVGFDAAAYSTSDKVWDKIGLIFKTVGNFDGIELGAFFNILEDHYKYCFDNLPEITCNLFFQYKRPEYCSVSRAKEWPTWKEPYFRYDLYMKQYDKLAYLAERVRDDAMVLYAAPAIKDLKALFVASRNKQIIELTNFTNVLDLKKLDLKENHRITYVNAIKKSVVFSEPISIENVDLMQLGMQSGKKGENSTKQNNTEFIISFAEKINSCLLETDYFREDYLSVKYRNQHLSNFPLLNALNTMSCLISIMGLHWILKG